MMFASHGHLIASHAFIQLKITVSGTRHWCLYNASMVAIIIELLFAIAFDVSPDRNLLQTMIGVYSLSGVGEEGRENG